MTGRARIGRAIALVLAPACVLALAGGCSRGGRDDPSADRSPLEVFAASSLTEAFRDLEGEFERAHPDVDVALTFAGSQVLRLQIEQGAHADVFASANVSHMQALVDAGLVSWPETFARNELVVIVPTANPAGVRSFEELTRATRIVIGTGNVPIGIYTRELFARAAAALGRDFVTEVQSHVVSEENNVRLVRANVELGEADAALVYRTDAASSDRVHVVPIPEALHVRASYQIGAIAGTRHAGPAAQFIRFARSDGGRQVLARHGFVVEAE